MKVKDLADDTASKAAFLLSDALLVGTIAYGIVNAMAPDASDEEKKLLANKMSG